ncbi:MULTISPECIES: cysteine hydrolase family protein [unclassified Shinella]|uniref:cysteine hydrolase family protein n=1 Tax=unclassified Shinella TaxID=2643062 RepID=UPI00234F6F1B|nr:MULTISPECIES: cysteine hydrolase family protein [unclassified Shinella]MCO5150084.1 cysteine hydrolase [Shinella sp.]MDC7262008.1 cysteine hydrolase [Shinella sp. HY16]MDC7268903.1 cysteine hydrolase [Shinella sp. YZ44]
MSKRAIIIVDLQKDYLSSGSFALTGIDAAAANAARVVEAGRGKGDRIIHVHHIAKDAASPLFAPGTDGIQPIPAVAPRQDDTVIVKNYPNSFRETALHQILRDGDIEDVVVVGAMSDVCIDATARAAADLGYNLTVVHDACATRDKAFGDSVVPARQVHATIMSALEFGYGKVTTTADFLS